MNYIYGYLISSLILIVYFQQTMGLIDQLKEDENTKLAETELGKGLTWFIISVLLILSIPVVFVCAWWVTRK